MKNSTCAPRGRAEGLRDSIKTILIITEAIVIIAVIFGNSLLFRAFQKFLFLRTASNSILVSLSAANSLTVVAFTFDIAFNTLKPDVNISLHAHHFLCKVSACSCFVIISVIILHLALISVERFIAVKFALRYQTIVTYRRAVLASFVVWLWAVAVTVVFPLALKADDSDSFKRLYQALHPCYKCPGQARPMPPPSAKGYLIFLMMSVLVIPILIILCSYGYIFLVSRKHRILMQEQGNIQGVPTAKEEMKGARTVATIVGVCLVSFLPLLVVTSYRFFGEPYHTNKARIIKQSVYIFALALNAILNPIIYGWRNAKLRSAFLKILKCK